MFVMMTKMQNKSNKPIDYSRLDAMEQYVRETSRYMMDSIHEFEHILDNLTSYIALPVEDVHPTEGHPMVQQSQPYCYTLRTSAINSIFCRYIAYVVEIPYINVGIWIFVVTLIGGINMLIVGGF